MIRSAARISDDDEVAPRGAGRKLVVAVLVFGVAVAGLGTMFLALHPERALRCLLEGRSGWELELPSAPVSEDEFRNAIDSQTDCVSVEVTYADTGASNDGFVVEPTGAKVWVGYNEPLAITVEG